MKIYFLAFVLAFIPFTTHAERSRCDKNPTKKDVDRCRYVVCSTYKFSKCMMEPCCTWIAGDSRQ